LKFFFDNNVSVNLARGLRALEGANSVVDILHCSDRWENGEIDDVDWIPVIAEEGRCILTFDARILTNPLERIAYRNHHAILLVPCKAFRKKNYWAQVVWLIKCWSGIKSWLDLTPNPGAYELQQNGIIRRL